MVMSTVGFAPLVMLQREGHIKAETSNNSSALAVFPQPAQTAVGSS
jgi:hypothetical protein